MSTLLLRNQGQRTLKEQQPICINPCKDACAWSLLIGLQWLYSRGHNKNKGRSIKWPWYQYKAYSKDFTQELIEVLNSFYMFLLLQSPEVLLFINHVGMCYPKGVCFLGGADFVWNRVWEQQRCMNVLICRLDSKWIRKKEYHANSKWILRNLSNLSNDDIKTVWKSVWILEARSENGFGKWHFLVWNRVRIWRTERHTLQAGPFFCLLSFGVLEKDSAWGESSRIFVEHVWHIARI